MVKKNTRSAAVSACLEKKMLPYQNKSALFFLLQLGGIYFEQKPIILFCRNCYNVAYSLIMNQRFLDQVKNHRLNKRIKLKFDFCNYDALDMRPMRFTSIDHLIFIMPKKVSYSYFLIGYNS